jgi:HAMP domain-containing protein
MSNRWSIFPAAWWAKWWPIKDQYVPTTIKAPALTITARTFGLSVAGRADVLGISARAAQISIAGRIDQLAATARTDGIGILSKTNQITMEADL